MVKTGYISFYEETEPTQDAQGNWVGGVKTQTDFVKCNLQVIKKEYVIVIDGQSQQASYSIYIDSNLMPVELNTINEISLKDNRGNDLGDFQIKNPEYLDLTKRVKIVV